MDRSFLRSEVNGFLSLVFVGVFTIGAWLIIWNAVFGENPIANAMATQVTSY